MDGIPEVSLTAIGLLHIFGVGQNGLKAIMLQDDIDQNSMLLNHKTRFVSL